MPQRSQRVAVVLIVGATMIAALTACGGGSSSGATGNDGAGAAASSDDNAAADVSSSSAGGSGGAPDPCSLLTTDQLSSAYGGASFSAGADTTDGVAAQRGFKACKWDAASLNGDFLLQTVASGGDLQQSASDLYDQSVGLYDGSTPGTAGDKSILLKDGAGFLAVKGDVFVQGNGIFIGDTNAPDAASTLLQDVVDQLP